MDLDKSVTVKVTLEKAQREIEERERKLTVSEQEKETLKVEVTSTKKYSFNVCENAGSSRRRRLS